MLKSIFFARICLFIQYREGILHSLGPISCVCVTEEQARQQVCKRAMWHVSGENPILPRIKGRMRPLKDQLSLLQLVDNPR